MIVQADKMPLSFSDQVSRLRGKGLIINDDAYAEDFLSKVNYYRLRGYYIHLHDNSIDKFDQGTTLEDIIQTYEFDDELRILTGRQLLKIEVNMRTQLAYRHSHEHGGLGYSCVSNFEDSDKYYEFYTNALNEVKRSSDLHIDHFIKNHNGKIPIWSLIEILSMTCLSKLLSNLLNPDLVYLSRIYGIPTPKMIKSNFYALSMLRNLCAHGNRIFNRSLTIKPALDHNDCKYIPGGITNSFYAILFAMKYLSLDKSSWNNFIDNLEGLLSKYSPTIDLNCLGMPQAWKAPLIKP